MRREIDEKYLGKVHTEKLTNEPFDDVICHSSCERKIFTMENNDIIYRRLKDEVVIDPLPYLGPCVDFGMGDVCLEEAENCFKFYVIDRAKKFKYEEFTNIIDAIHKLVSFYEENKMVDNPEKMETILFQTLVFDKEDEDNNIHKK